MHKAYLLLGSNIQKEYYIKKGIQYVSNQCKVLRCTDIYETRSTIDPDDTFLNVGMLIETNFTPFELKKTVLCDIESKCDRIRTLDKNNPRTLDVDLCLYDELEIFYHLAAPTTENDIKKLNGKLKQVDFIPKKIKEYIINDIFKLFKLMTIPGNAIDVVEVLMYYRNIIMFHSLENENLKESLLMIKYYYIKKNNKFVKIQTYCNNDLKKRNFYQSIIYKILKFYYHNNLYYKREMKLPIIGYKNNIPVLNPKFFKFR